MEKITQNNALEMLKEFDVNSSKMPKELIEAIRLENKQIVLEDGTKTVAAVYCTGSKYNPDKDSMDGHEAYTHEIDAILIKEGIIDDSTPYEQRKKRPLIRINVVKGEKNIVISTGGVISGDEIIFDVETGKRLTPKNTSPADRIAEVLKN